MKLVQDVLRSLAAGISPSCHGFSITRTLATSSASGIITIYSYFVVIHTFITTMSMTLIHISFVYSFTAIDPYANTNTSETLDDFERSIFGDLPGSSLTSSSFFQKLDQQKKALDRSRMNGPSRRSGFLDGLDDSFTSLTDGMDGKLKEAATYFEYDMNEIEKDDYKFRSDVTFWPGNTYDVKVLSTIINIKQ